MASWVFDLVDANGTGLTDGGIIDAKAASVTVQRGLPRMAQIALPLTGYAASVIAQETFQPYLRGWRTGSDGERVLRFYGPVWVDEAQGSGGFDLMMVTALDPQILLGKRFSEAEFVATDAGTIIKTMVDTTNSSDGETGIRTDPGNVTASTSIDYDARGNKPSIQSVIEQLQNQVDGVECWVEPIEYAAGKIGDLYAAPIRGGSDLDVSFGYGAGTSGNCTQMSRVRNKDVMENDSNAYTDTLAARSTDATSIAAFRAMLGFTSYTSEVDQANLNNLASGRIERFSNMARIAEYKCTPSSRAPALWDDFNIGDSVWLDFRKGVEFRVRKRVVSAKIDIADNGVEKLGQIEFGSTVA